MRRILAATLIGVLTGSLLTTIEPRTAPQASASENSVSIGSCEVTVTVSGTPLTGPSEDNEIGAPSDNPSHVVVSEESGECILQFVQPMVEMVWSFPYPLAQFDVLIVGGGGSGSVGGGGAGGYYETFSDSNNPAIQVPSGAESATIRGGQGGQKVSGNVNGNDGAHSGLFFDTYSGNSSDIFSDGGSTTPKNPTVSEHAIVMAGGGGGAKNSGTGRPGGSGGGSVNDSSGGSGVNGPSPLSAGSAGGFGTQGGGAYGCRDNTGGGGGGGAGGRTGSNTICDTEEGVYKGGSGGEGRSSSITGSSITYAGGGGGSFSGGGGTTSGGSGGGGDGDNGTSNSDGTDRRGGGGGGDTTPANTGSGGDGIVVLRIPLPPVGPDPVFGSVEQTETGFEVPISNYYSVASDGSGVGVNWSVSATNGATVSIDGSGIVSVVFSEAALAGLAAGASLSSTATATATAAASGYSTASASMGSAGQSRSGQASLTVSGSDVLRFGGSITVAASGGSGSGAVAFALTSASVTAGCELTGSVLSAGSADAGDSCEVEATRASDSDFVAKTVSETFTIGKADRFVSFTSSVPADPRVNDTYTPTAEATGDGVVSFSVPGGQSVCSIDGDGVVSFDSEGICTITASSGSDTNYLAATDVTQVIEVGLANQTITFDAVADKDFDDRPFQLSASSSRGLDVSFETTDPDSTDSNAFDSAVCSVTQGGVVSIDGTGLCEITASQDGVDGQVAEASKVVRSFRVQAVVPGAPRLTSVGFGDGSLTVGFIAPDYVGGGTVSAYRAVATDGDGNEFVENDCGASSPCTVEGLTNGTEYSVTVAAVNEAGVGPVSNVSPVVVPATAADAVGGLSAVPGNETLAVSWEEPDSFGGGDFEKYVVTLTSDGAAVDGQDPVEIVDVDGPNDDGAVSTTFSGLANGTAYDVKVVTISSANTEAIEGNTAEIVGVPAVAPSVVRDVEAVLVGTSGAFVSWATPVSDGGLPVTSYEVTPESLLCEFENATDQFCEITGLARGRTVSISVAGVNGIGAGQSVTVSVSTPALPSSGGGDDDDEANPAPTAGPTTVPGRPGVPGGVPGRPGGNPGGVGSPGVTPGGGTPPPPPGGTAGSPVTPERPGATVGGVPVPTTTTASPGGRGVSVSAGGVDVGVDVPDSGDGAGGVIDRDGTPEPVVTPGQGKTVSGAGAAPGSVVDVWLPGRGGNAPTNIAQIPVGEDGTFSADVDVFAVSDEPLPIGRNVVQIVTTNAEGEDIVVDMPFTLTQGEPAPEVLRDTGSTPDAPASGIINTNKGEPTETRVVSDPSRGLVSVESDTWAFTVGINTNSGVVEGADTDTVIRTTSNTEVTVSGSGFMADTRVDVWAFSTPTLLGNATVDSDGTVSVTVTVTPQSLEVGAHTLQLQAVGQDGFIRTSNLPIEIQDTPASLTTGDSAGTLLWWTVSIAAAIIVLALLVAYLLRRRQRA